MTGQDEEPELRVEHCHRRAREMMDAADCTESHRAKAEFLRLAMEWMKLATAIGQSQRAGQG